MAADFINSSKWRAKEGESVTKITATVFCKLIILVTPNYSEIFNLLEARPQGPAHTQGKKISQGVKSKKEESMSAMK